VRNPGSRRLQIGSITSIALALVGCGHAGSSTPGAAAQIAARGGVDAKSAGTGAGGTRVVTGEAGEPAALGGSGGAGAQSQATPAAGTGAAGDTSTQGPLSNDAGNAAPNLQAMDLVVSPDGKDSASGTQAEPTTLSAALTRVTPGHTIYVRAGKYTFDAQITIEQANSGTADQPKRLWAFGDDKPVLDFSAEPYGKDSNPRGLQINADHWHVKGLTVQGAADNGIYVAGKANVIENCIVHGNRDTGLQIGRSASSMTQLADWPSDNLILNCESYDNYDAPPGSGENADGFAAKLTVGTGNVFRGCVSHNNIDDGWDLYTKSDTGAIGPVTIDQCISYHNGTLTDGTTNSNGDRNGFKLGGESIAVAHVVTRSVAFGNGKNGFTWNSNPGAIRLSNTLAFDNAAGNYKFGDSSTTTQAVFTNNVSFWTTTSGVQSDKALGSDADSSNCWWTTSGSAASKNAKGLVVSAADFAAALDGAKVLRGADGSPDFTPFKLASGSDLIDAGALPAGALPFDPAYYKGKPDLGAVESQ
jgi:hypothetical protein